MERKMGNKGIAKGKKDGFHATIVQAPFYSLYQLGIVRHLPELPVDLFDSDYVNGTGCRIARRAGEPADVCGPIQFGRIIFKL